jgi:hypothetical protein
MPIPVTASCLMCRDRLPENDGAKNRKLNDEMQEFRKDLTFIMNGHSMILLRTGKSDGFRMSANETSTVHGIYSFLSRRILLDDVYPLALKNIKRVREGYQFAGVLHFPTHILLF